MRHTVETQKRAWHLWAALAVLAVLAWCSPEMVPDYTTHKSEEAR